jgi:integrase/recombinase XerD
MRSKGLSSSTINQRISALSSFYRYVCEKYTVRPKENLHDFNPALAVDRPTLKSYKEASYLTPDQVKAFIAAIEGNDPHTLRNRAMFLMYLFTGRRNTEVRKLTWGDFRKISKTLWQYRWEGKGSERWDMVPPPAMQAIQEYLKAIERWDGLQDDDYLFTALTANASRLPNVEDFEPHAKPISSSEVRRLVRRYVREAGIEAKDITVHSLRHTFVMLLREAKIDITEIQDIIGHSSSDVTKKYVHTLEGQQSAGWEAVSEVLGL